MYKTRTPRRGRSEPSSRTASPRGGSASDDRRSARPCSAASVTLFSLAGCSSEFSGQVAVDGEPFVISSCRSGRVYGFTGVELVADSGRRLRLIQTPTGKPDVAVLAAGSETGDRLTDCGALTVNDQNSTINDVKNVDGHAMLSCAADGHTVEGDVTFSNCH